MGVDPSMTGRSDNLRCKSSATPWHTKKSEVAGKPKVSETWLRNSQTLIVGQVG
jgi:hypothetical protein